MRLVTYSVGDAPPRAGVRVGHRVLDIEAGSRVDGEPLPCTMRALLREGRGRLARVRALAKAAQVSAGRFSAWMHEEGAIRFHPPVPDASRVLSAEASDDGRVAATVMPVGRLAGHNTRIARARDAQPIASAPRLVYVLGHDVEEVDGEDALDHVAGVTIMDQLSVADAATPTPVGPEIITLDEIAHPEELWLTSIVNGRERLRLRLNQQADALGIVLREQSRSEPFAAGDLVAIGTVGTERVALAPGDVVECSLEGLVTLRTTIVAA